MWLATCREQQQQQQQQQQLDLGRGIKMASCWTLVAASQRPPASFTFSVSLCVSTLRGFIKHFL
jgi:hypothetical protein